MNKYFQAFLQEEALRSEAFGETLSQVISVIVINFDSVSVYYSLRSFIAPHNINFTYQLLFTCRHAFNVSLHTTHCTFFSTCNPRNNVIGKIPEKISSEFTHEVTDGPIRMNFELIKQYACNLHLDFHLYNFYVRILWHNVATWLLQLVFLPSVMYFLIPPLLPSEPVTSTIFLFIFI